MPEDIDPHTPEAPSDPWTDDACPSCGADMGGAFCASCGQRRLRDDEYSLGRLVRDGLQDFFSVDAKFWRSFRILFAQPGQLTRDYMEGRRGGRLGPFQLFIAANLIYFFVQPYSGFTGFNTTLISHMDRQVYSQPAGIRDLVLDEIDRRIEDRVRQEGARRTAPGPTAAPADPYQTFYPTAGWTVDDSLAFVNEASSIEGEVYPNRFDARGEVNARSLVFLVVPMLALVLTLLYAGTRVPFVQHAVFAIHFTAWQLTFIMSLALPLLIVMVRAGRQLVATVAGEAGQAFLASPNVLLFIDLLLEYGAIFFVVPYAYLALRRVYGSGRIPTVARTVVLLFAAQFVNITYRFILFWVTFASV